MALSVRIIDSPRGETVTKWYVVFPKEGGKIGRGNDSTLVLNDASRIVSNVHAEITLSGNSYLITDLSTNGVFINRAKTPLGRNKSIGLNDGDVLGIGGYTLIISIDEVENNKSSQKNEEVFDPFTKDKDSKPGESKEVNKTTDDNLAFPDPFLNVDVKKNNDPYVTATSYDYTKSNNLDIDLQPKDDILDDAKEFEIREDPFLVSSTTQVGKSSIAPRAPKPLSLDGRNMFGNNPFDRNNEIIDTPLGELAEGNSDMSFLTLQIAIKRQQEIMEKAMLMALDRIFKEMGPKKFVETSMIFNKSFFFRPNYWKTYQEYYNHNIESNEWQQKFIMYFRESLEIIKNSNN